MFRKFIILSFILIFTTLLHSKEKIVIFHAGSLSVPFSEIEKEFETNFPQYDILRESSGSRECARKITDIKRDADIMASADYKVIDDLLIPDYADFNLLFAKNEMIIAYTDKSKFASEITSQNWHQIFLKKDVKIGHSNPNLDPCGYRAVLVTKLAERYYNHKDFFQTLLGYSDHYNNGDENKSKVIVRAKETDLLGLLETGAIDYLYIYKSVAIQHSLKYINLPKELSLADFSMKDYYKTATFKIIGKKPDSWIEIKGEPMIYGITLIKNAPNTKGAVEFIKFLLSDSGINIIEKNGQEFIKPLIIIGDKAKYQKFFSYNGDTQSK